MDVGERMTPNNLFSDAVREEFALTMQRYRFSIPFALDKNVLDSGCGVGNGSFLLSGVAANVVAIDNDPEAIRFAQTYYPNTNLTFLVHDALEALPEHFEMIASLDVIEHVKDPKAYLRSLDAQLARSGKLILSTPNKSMLQLVYPEHNHFHVHEMDLDELTDILSASFKINALYGQHLTADGPQIHEAMKDARTFIVVCSKK